MALVWIPSLLRDLTGGQETVPAAGATVGQVVEALEQEYPGIRERLCTNDGMRPGIAVAVDGRITNLGLRQAVGADSEVHFLPAVGGG